MLRRSLSGEICVVDVIVGMRCGYERKKVGVIPMVRESCGYGSKKCTSQQKVDTFFCFYTSLSNHSTPCTVLESDNSESMQDVLH